MNPDSLDSRLARLERRARISTAALLALLGTTLLSAFAATRGDEIVRAHSIQLVDDEGRVRVELGLDAEGSAGLFLRDEEHRLRASLTHDAAQTALFLLDESGATRVGLAQFAHGGGGLALHGAEAKGAAVLYFKGKGQLTFFDDEGGVIEKLPE